MITPKKKKKFWTMTRSLERKWTSFQGNMTTW